jgi:hypothetical protein
VTERSVSLFEIIDSRRRATHHVATNEFTKGDIAEANSWLRRLSMQFPENDFDKVMTVLESDDIEVTTFKIHMEYRRKDATPETED